MRVSAGMARRLKRGIFRHSLTPYWNFSVIQGWAKEWALGCVNPASWLPPAAGGEVTQPRAPFFTSVEDTKSMGHVWPPPVSFISWRPLEAEETWENR